MCPLTGLPARDITPSKGRRSARTSLSVCLSIDISYTYIYIYIYIHICKCIYLSIDIHIYIYIYINRSAPGARGAKVSLLEVHLLLTNYQNGKPIAVHLHTAPSSYTMHRSIENSTPPQNRQLNISSSNSKQYVDNFVRVLTF